MPLTHSQTEQVKKQIIQQIENSFPPESKEGAKRQLEQMTPEQLEQFLIQNKLIKDLPDSEQSPNTSSKMQQSPFRLIASEEIPSHKIAENNDAIAVLEINPISKGHIIIIPKKEVFETEELPESIFSLTKKISQKMKSNLSPKPKDVSMFVNKVLGEIIINLIPVYNNENLNSERHQITEEELEELQEVLKIEEQDNSSFIRVERKKGGVLEQKEKEEKSEYTRLPRRIP